MVPVKNIVFVDSSYAAVSNPISNVKADSVVFEVSGSAGACLAKVEAQVDLEGEDWTELAGIDLTDLSVVTEGITKDGIYQYPCAGIQKIRVNLVTADGSIKIFGRFVLEGV